MSLLLNEVRIFYIQLMLYGGSVPLIWICFKETRQEVILKQKGIQPTAELATEKQTWLKFLYEAVILPSHLLCTEPVVFCFTLLSALSYGLVFLGTQSVAQVYTTLYGWEEYETGLVQVALVLGQIVGAIVCLPQNQFFAKRYLASGTPVQSLETSVAELRLPICIVGSLFGLTGGLFWYGWTAISRLHWILPTVGLSILGFGVMTVMQAIMMYVTDAYEKYAGSASAAVCFGENMFAAYLPLCAFSMYSALGFNWASSLLAFLACAMSVAPVLLMVRGRSIRGRSRFILKAGFATQAG